VCLDTQRWSDAYTSFVLEIAPHSALIIGLVESAEPQGSVEVVCAHTCVIVHVQ
jgi:hypothetical protein